MHIYRDTHRLRRWRRDRGSNFRKSDTTFQCCSIVDLCSHGVCCSDQPPQDPWTRAFHKCRTCARSGAACIRTLRKRFHWWRARLHTTLDHQGTEIGVVMMVELELSPVQLGRMCRKAYGNRVPHRTSIVPIRSLQAETCHSLVGLRTCP